MLKKISLKQKCWLLSSGICLAVSVASVMPSHAMEIEYDFGNGWKGGIRVGGGAPRQRALPLYEHEVCTKEEAKVRINQSYRTYLERDVDPAGLKAWMKNFNKYGIDWVERHIFNSQEANNLRISKINQLHNTYLGCDVEPSRLKAWVKAYRRHGIGWVANEIANSEETRMRRAVGTDGQIENGHRPTAKVEQSLPTAKVEPLLDDYNIINIQRYAVAITQEEEGQHNLANFNYHLAIGE